MDNMEKNGNNVKDTEEFESEPIETNEGETKKNNGKLFTQEEVNEIIKKRLMREKGKEERKGAGDEITEREKSIEEREVLVSARENRVACCELANEKGYPKELLDILDTSDPDKFKDQADRLVALYNEKHPKEYPGAKRNTANHRDIGQNPFPNKKHVPRQHEYYY